jgi:hypothetical protein
MNNDITNERVEKIGVILGIAFLAIAACAAPILLFA